MKKIITLVTMFVLSAGCLMAQGVFTYQAVVYDGTSLVVDQDVTASVTITDGTHNFTQILPPADNADYPSIHTSLNGLAVLSIGDIEDEDFMAMDWSKATIKVDFTVLGENSATINGTDEQIPAVPYALQANAKITTPMVVDYISHATMEDVNAILAATEKNKDAEHNNVTLHDTVLHAIIDSIMAHYDLAKDIMMSYIAAADAQDVDQLFTALTGNDALMEALATIVKSNLMTTEGKQMIYEVLVNYASRLTDGDVAAILNAIPAAARNEAIKKALLYYLGLQVNYNDEDIQAAMEDLAKYYIEHINTTQVNNLIYTIEHNQHGAMPVLQAQFNAWMAAYVQKVLNEYYYCPGGAPDLCAVWDELKNGSSADNCLIFASNTFDLTYFDGTYTGTFQYNLGEATNVSYTVSVGDIELDNSYSIIAGQTAGTWVLEIDQNDLTDELGYTPASSFEVTIVYSYTCNNETGLTKTITGSYTEQQQGDNSGGGNSNTCFELDMLNSASSIPLAPYNDFGTIYFATINYTGDFPFISSQSLPSISITRNGETTNDEIPVDFVTFEETGSGVLLVKLSCGDSSNVPVENTLSSGDSFTVQFNLGSVSCPEYTVTLQYTK